MTKKDKKVLIKEEDLKIVDGKIIIDNKEFANAIEAEEFFIDGDEAQDGIKLGVTVEKT